MRLIRDSSGHPSWTMTLSIPIVVLLTLHYLLGGIDIKIATTSVVIAPVPGADYALTVGVWLGFLAQRNYVAAKFSRKKSLATGASA